MKKLLKKDFIIILFSILLSIVINFQIIILNNHKSFGFIRNSNLFILILLIILFSFIIYFILKFLLKYITKLKFKTYNYTKKDLKKIFIFSFLLMILVWLICFITYYPGGGNYDTYYQLQSPIYASSQHPIGYSFLLNIFIIIIGHNILHSSIVGWALFSIFQMLIMASSISLAICFLAKRKIPKIFIIILSLFYAFIPIYASYAIFGIKDVMFAIIILYLVLLLIKLSESKGELLHSKLFILLYIIIGIFMFETRSNAIIIYLLTTIFMIIKYYKSCPKLFMILLIIPLLFNSLVNKVIESKYGVKHYFQESAAIPLQQLSAVVYVDGNLNESEKEYLNSLLDLEIIKKNYENGNADAIKWDEHFNRETLQYSKGKFLKTWMSVLFKNFDTYVESYLLQVYYFWTINPLTISTNMYVDVHTDKVTGYVGEIKDQYDIKAPDLLPQKMQTKLENFYSKTSNFLSEGTCFWLFMFLMLILISKKRSDLLIIGMPLFTVWLGMMLASPLSGSLRYMFPFVLILPIITIYVLNVKNQTKD